MCGHRLSIDDERSVYKLRYLNVLWLSNPNAVSNSMPRHVSDHSMSIDRFLCRDLVRSGYPMSNSV
jgi:hypothetical protein